MAWLMLLLRYFEVRRMSFSEIAYLRPTPLLYLGYSIPHVVRSSCLARPVELKRWDAQVAE